MRHRTKYVLIGAAFLLFTLGATAQAASFAAAAPTWGDFRWLTLFEGLGGYTTQGHVWADGTQLRLATEQVRGSRAWLIKQPAWQNFLSFAQPSQLQTALVISTSTGMTAYLVHGSAMESTGRSYYGFKVVNNSLWGVSSGNGTSTEQAVLLSNVLSPTEVYLVEARYYPKSRVEFTLRTPVNGKTTKGVIRRGLPAITNRPHIDLVNATVESTD
ncbi:MAG: hypothetical protein HY978_04665, partial [Candidatus Liptonbacteria bacterium]|nr:hypothetical protein [Candidatus Liptonbacteria bacterium]